MEFKKRGFKKKRVQKFKTKRVQNKEGSNETP